MYYITLTRYSSLNQADPDEDPASPGDDWEVTLPIIGFDDNPDYEGEEFTFMSGKQVRDTRLREAISLELFPFSNVPNGGEWGWEDFKALKKFLVGAFVEVVSCTLPRTASSEHPTGKFTLQGISTSRNNSAGNTGVSIELKRAQLGEF
jgi:hypothetical protein